MKINLYCKSLIKYKRRKSCVVNIGDIPLGGDYPVRLQSMTTTNTMDTISTVNQSIRMIKAGSDYVRITAPSLKQASNLYNIKKELKKRGYKTPIIADIHFTPKAAIKAARLVEKVRINPGNFVDKKKFKFINYNDKQYNEELDRIYKHFIPLIDICRLEGTAIRIGSNHGSLSDRILSRYGDTPEGMVESAMEFLRICNEVNFHEIVLSMKSSNTRVMVQAYRLLVKQMNDEKMNYPLHLGVTEAGEGEDGRIKSALGIGALLEDGLGDTIRVSLTEEPEVEIPVAKKIVDRYKNRKNCNVNSKVYNIKYSPYEYKKRKSIEVLNIGGDNTTRIVIDFSSEKNISREKLEKIGYSYFIKEDKWGMNDFATDFIYLGNNKINFEIPPMLNIIQRYNIWKDYRKNNTYPIFDDLDNYFDSSIKDTKLNFIKVKLEDLSFRLISKLKYENSIVLIIYTDGEVGICDQREIFFKLLDNECHVPVILNRKYKNYSLEKLQLYAATDLGTLLIDGFGDGIFLQMEKYNLINEINKSSFGILQASRNRISKTEYISCPSCGRTLFDLQSTTAIIRQKTSHLKGVKIGIMGCIVNGPGEMADADYGYVGTGINKISLYKGQEVVLPNVPVEQALDSLIRIIKDDGAWVEPKNKKKQLKID